MNTLSDTPRTDAARKASGSAYIMGITAETLERELNDAKIRIIELETELKEVKSDADEDASNAQFHRKQYMELKACIADLEKDRDNWKNKAFEVVHERMKEQMTSIQPSVYEYFDKPNKPGWWWFRLWENSAWIPLECYRKQNQIWVDGGRNQYPATYYTTGVWVPAIPPASLIKNE